MMRPLIFVWSRIIVVATICAIFLPPDRLAPDHVMHAGLVTFAAGVWAVGDWLFWEEK